jgi:hypothetical protein
MQQRAIQQTISADSKASSAFGRQRTASKFYIHGLTSCAARAITTERPSYSNILAVGIEYDIETNYKNHRLLY